MRKFAIYGKGGIGKSTTTANVSALGIDWKKSRPNRCDPKADSTLNLLHGEPVMPVMDYYRQYTEGPDFEHIGREGYGGVFCIETGGPTPGLAAPEGASSLPSTSSTSWKSLKNFRRMLSCMTSWATSSAAVFRLRFATAMPMKSSSSRREKRWPSMRRPISLKP